MAEDVQLNVPSAHQRYLEQVVNAPDPEPNFHDALNPSDAQVVSDEGYVGVDPIYQNHANDTEKPYAAQGGALQAAEDAFVESLTGEAPVHEEQVDDEVVDDEDDK